MTDKLHYPDLFKTINIDETKDRLTLEIKNLFDVVYGEVDVVYGAKIRDPNILAHLTKSPDVSEASQLFWDYENPKTRDIDHLALTIMRGFITIGIQHRGRGIESVDFRKSARIYDRSNVESIANGLDSELSLSPFEKDFYFVTVANLGLTNQIKQFHAQNESNAAIFANAA